MTRYKLTIEYDGAPFVGWQRQDNGPSIQEALEEAIFAFCGERSLPVGAGRTDAGVHAGGQVAHVDLTREVKAATMRDAVNFHLRPQPITILAAEGVEIDPQREDGEYGKFAWIVDPEGNRIELWQAPKESASGG